MPTKWLGRWCANRFRSDELKPPAPVPGIAWWKVRTPVIGTDEESATGLRGNFVVDHEAELVRRCLDGEPGAVRTFVERYQGMVFGLCYRMLSHREDAEDVAQEVFVRAIRHLAGWDSERRLKPWLLTIAANRCRTELRKRSRLPVLTEFEAESAHVEPDGESLALSEEIQRAVDGLPESHRTCFILFYQQGLSCAEVAEVMAHPVGTIKIWLHRARRELAGALRRRGVVHENGHEPNRI